MQEYIYAHPITAMALLGGCLLVILLVVVLLFLIEARNARKMQALIYTDPLTGLKNYKALVESGPRLLAKRGPEGYALVYLDAHQFKYINDTYGYKVGNEVLVAISRALQRFIGKGEQFARVYADRFALLLLYDSQESFQKRLEGLLEELGRLPCKTLGKINLIFRAGVYRFADGLCDMEQALDLANYATKTVEPQFSGTLAFYDSGIMQKIMTEKKLESEMQTALEQGTIIPFYQPKVDVPVSYTHLRGGDRWSDQRHRGIHCQFKPADIRL